MSRVRDWVCQVRPSNPHRGGYLIDEDFFRPGKVMYLTFEKGIDVTMYNPHSDTIIVENSSFCVVRKPFTSSPRTTINPRTGEERTYSTRDPNILCVCLPERVQGREVVFYSPNLNPLTIR